MNNEWDNWAHESNREGFLSVNEVSEDNICEVYCKKCDEFYLERKMYCPKCKPKIPKKYPLDEALRAIDKEVVKNKKPSREYLYWKIYGTLKGFER